MQSIGLAKVFVLKGFEAFLVNYQKMQSIGIPALREAGAVCLAAWETMVFHWFSNVS